MDTDARTADEILGASWEAYAREANDSAGGDFPGRDEVVELFGEPDPFEAVVAPFGATWPGLAATPSAPGEDADAVAARVLAALKDEGDFEGLRLLDAPCRGADLVAVADALGLTGCWPYTPAEVATVMVSWEERFGTRLVGIGGDRLILSVAAPGTTAGEAEAIAAEHFAFAPDTIVQGFEETLRAHADHQVLDKDAWFFQWD